MIYGAGVTDDAPLSDTEIDDRMRAAERALGSAPGETVPGNTALSAARDALKLLRLGLMTASENAERKKDPAKPTFP